MCRGPLQVNFRELDGFEYPLHRAYMYPAAFTQQAVRYALRFRSADGVVIDPFAGSGTVCVEAWLRGLESACLDLNPMVEVMVRAKTYSGSPGRILEAARSAVEGVGGCLECPRWSRIGYWYHPAILEELCRLRCSLSSVLERVDPKLGAMLLLAFFKAARKLSYADPAVPKLYRPKKKPWRRDELVEGIVKGGKAGEAVKEYFMGSARTLARLTAESRKAVGGGGPEPLVLAGVDVVEGLGRVLGDAVKEPGIVITSPPYLSAHEYIRSFKLELAWMGYGDGDLRRLSRLEIPYRRVPPYSVESDTFDEYRLKVDGKSRALYESYFHAVVRVLDEAVKALARGGVIAVMVGRPKLGGVEVPIDKVLLEHLENRGLECLGWFVDEIKRRRLPGGRKNANPAGMRHEFMIILEKARAA